ncbi:MAG: protein arginine kinase [Victivallaceae bacterium]|nr:protein arginine kinase [Victivallaceae bacterium]
MTPETADVLLGNEVSFLAGADAGNGCDIAISSRIRLARNLAEMPFPGSASDEMREKISDAVADVVDPRLFGGKVHLFEMASLSPVDRDVLMERRLASADFIRRTGGAKLLVRNDERISLMVNEEDHIRLQAIRPGFQLPALWEEISRIDDRLGRKLPFAFDEKLGYLTSCPTNVGTGMRASVMLHLPALTLSGRIGATVQGIQKLNLAVRGIYGEGSDNRGNFYQISNQHTLGESEEEILGRFSAVIDQLINFEREARAALLQKDRFGMLDFVGRSFGALRYAYKMPGGEALNHLSGVRVGVDMHLFENLDIRCVNELWIATQNGHLQKNAGRELSAAERDVERARICREKLRQGRN